MSCSTKCRRTGACADFCPLGLEEPCRIDCEVNDQEDDYEDECYPA